MNSDNRYWLENPCALLDLGEDLLEQTARLEDSQLKSTNGWSQKIVGFFITKKY